MITLITAVPGSGKTLYTIGLINKALSEGRPVFHNINGLVYKKFTNHHLLQESPDDWRDTPEGSLVVYDEAQQAHLYPSNAQRGKVEDARLTAMETHRHTGHDLIFITQAPTFVHHHIRKLVGEHIHLYRGRGLGGAMRYEWSHTCDAPNDRREQERATAEFWKFPKEHFSFYTSAVMHTHKFKFPVKIAAAFAAAFALAGYSAFNLYSNDGLSVLNDPVPALSIAAAQTEAQPVRADAIYSWSKSPQTVPVAGCIANKVRNRCMCFSAEGVTLELEHAQCLSIIDSPLPRQFSASKSSQNI